MRTSSLFIVLSVALLLAGGVALADPPETKTFELPDDLSAPDSNGWQTTAIASGNWGGRNADGSFAVAWESNSPDLPALVGRWAEVTIPGTNGRVPVWVEIGYLAGIANDDFCVLIEKWRDSASGPRYFVAIGCADEDENSTVEEWLVGENAAHFDLPDVFHPGQDVTVQIRVTGNAWSGFGTWGQFGVDYIRVRFE